MTYSPFRVPGSAPGARVPSTGDVDLDWGSWIKSQKEFECVSLLGPHYSFDEIPLSEFRLLPHHPIWGQHGGKEWAVRNIDDA